MHEAVCCHFFEFQVDQYFHLMLMHDCMLICSGPIQSFTNVLFFVSLNEAFIWMVLLTAFASNLPVFEEDWDGYTYIAVLVKK